PRGRRPGRRRGRPAGGRRCPRGGLGARPGAGRGRLVTSLAELLAPAVWAEIGDRRHPIYLGPGLIDRLGPLWAERAAGPGVLVVHDEAVAGLAERAAASLAAAGLRVVPAAVASGERS